MSNNLSLTAPTETISVITEAHTEDPESNVIPSLNMVIPPLSPIIEYVPEILPQSSVNEDFSNPFESDSVNEYYNTTDYQASTIYDAIPVFTTNESIPLNTIFVSTIERLHHDARVSRNLRIMDSFLDLIREDEEAEEEMIRHAMRESFDEDQQKRLIDVSRELDIHTCDYSKDSDELANHGTCRICFEDYVEKEEIGILQCKHFFHNECIQEWGKRKPACPYCDIEIPVVSNEPSCKKQKTN